MPILQTHAEADPSHTFDITQRYIQAFDQRWDEYLSLLETTILKNDALQYAPFINQEPRSRIGDEHGNPQQLAAAVVAYQQTLQGMLLAGDNVNNWQQSYIQQWFIRGVQQSNQQLAGVGFPNPDLSPTQITNDPFMQDALQSLKQQNFDLLKTVQQDVNGLTGDQLEEIIARGYRENLTSRQINREVFNAIQDLTEKTAKHRSRLIARTEVVRANGEARRLNLRRRGVRELEWILSADPCPICQGNALRTYTPEEIMGYFPAHPQELCSFGPKT